MATTEQKKEERFEVKIGLPEGKEWPSNQLQDISDFIKEANKKRSPADRLATRLLSIRYRMEEYLEDNEITFGHMSSVEHFLGEYLKALGMSLKSFAINIDTTDGNLKKYLSGERKFNTDLAMKFGHFFHTTPDLWIYINTKNELLKLKKEKRQTKLYKKYDYKKVLQVA